MLKQKRDMNLLNDIVEKLLRAEPLPDKNKDHSLTGIWSGYRECHVAPDWLLIYQIKDNILVLSLTRTGTHSELFGKRK